MLGAHVVFHLCTGYFVLCTQQSYLVLYSHPLSHLCPVYFVLCAHLLFHLCTGYLVLCTHQLSHLWTGYFLFCTHLLSHLCTGYLVFSSTHRKQPIGDWQVEAVRGEQTWLTVSDLSPNTKYFFKLQARNAKGYGPLSIAVPYKTPKGMMLLMC